MIVMRFLFSLGIGLSLLFGPLNLPLQAAQAAPEGVKRYVESSGSPANDCLTPDTPCSLDEAMAEAGDGDTIYLFEGTYTHYNHVNIIDLGPGKNVTLKGGWYAHTHLGLITIVWTDPWDHPSILDGENERRGIYIHDGIAPVIDGIKIYNGVADPTQHDLCTGDDMVTDACGGGIYIYHAAATIKNCNFDSNYANQGAVALGFGGAIFVESPTGPVLIQDNMFYHNRPAFLTDGDGGAIAIHGGPGGVDIVGNNFFANTANGSGGAISANAYNGALLWIHENQIHENMAPQGAAIYLISVDQALISHNYIRSQGDWEGAGDTTISSIYSGLYFNRNSLIDNMSDYGLTIYNDNGTDPNVINNLFLRSGQLASIRIIGHGGISGTEITTAHLKHNTMDGRGQAGSIAIKVNSINCDVVYCAEAVVENTILYQYPTGYSALVSDQARITADYTLFSLVINISDGAVLSSNEFFADDPGFRDSFDYDYHLAQNSPARDIGKDAGVDIDFEADPRPFGDGFDLGYDEYTPNYSFLPLILK